MSSYDAIDLLRRHDPARGLAPLPDEERRLLHDRIVAAPGPARARRPRRLLTLAVAVAAAAVVGAAVAWAAGALSPVSLFESNPQHDGGQAGDLWDQHVLPASVVEAASVEIPTVGRVGFWYGRTAQGGWCGALRLPSGAWIGTAKDPVDGGGTVPGCFPTREQVNAAAGSQPVYVLDGFDYQEGDVDLRRAGGPFWRIRYGRITAPGAVGVTDLVSGRSAPVVHGDLFELAIPDPDPTEQTPLRLVAYDGDGKVVAREP
jgi:hypothetical protein